MRGRGGLSKLVRGNKMRFGLKFTAIVALGVLVASVPLTLTRHVDTFANRKGDRLQVPDAASSLPARVWSEGNTTYAEQWMGE